MKNTARTLVNVGFGAVLIALFLLVYIALTELQAINQGMARLVGDANVKTQAAVKMRDAMLLRSKSMQVIQNRDKIFERDEEYTRFTQYGDMFEGARQELISKSVDERAQNILLRLDNALRLANPLADQAMAELRKGNTQASRDALYSAEKAQAVVIDLLDMLVELERDLAFNSLNDNQESYLRTHKIILIISFIGLIFAVVIAFNLIRNASTRNKEVSYQAKHDALTELVNRIEFERQLSDLIAQAKNDRSQHALMFMDLDQFKIVNDTCGHPAGDELLRQISKALAEKIRKSDTLARLGGDEFGLLLTNCSLEQAKGIAENLRKTVHDFQFLWEDNSFSLGVSIGLVPINRNSSNLAKLLSIADSACYAAKDQGKNRIHVCQEDDIEVTRRYGEMRWIPKINQALDGDGFILHYQDVVPVKDASKHKIHYEILVRMLEHTGKLVYPATFLSLAERYGLITRIDRWITSYMLRWLAEHSLNHAPMIFGINLSGQTISEKEFASEVEILLQEYDVGPEMICFELSESAAIANFSSAKEFIHRIKDLGCLIAFDDFGSGPSAYNYLGELPVDFLKIDGRFIKSITHDRINMVIVDAITRIAHLAGKKTIAEGVETLEILREIEQFDIDYVQGFQISKPKPLDELATLTSSLINTG